jgi:hypothetical protein
MAVMVMSMHALLIGDLRGQRAQVARLAGRARGRARLQPLRDRRQQIVPRDALLGREVAEAGTALEAGHEITGAHAEQICDIAQNRRHGLPATGRGLSAAEQLDGMGHRAG